MFQTLLKRFLSGNCNLFMSEIIKRMKLLNIHTLTYEHVVSEIQSEATTNKSEDWLIRLVNKAKPTGKVFKSFFLSTTWLSFLYIETVNSEKTTLPYQKHFLSRLNANYFLLVIFTVFHAIFVIRSANIDLRIRRRNNQHCNFHIKFRFLGINCCSTQS